MNKTVEIYVRIFGQFMRAANNVSRGPHVSRLMENKGLRVTHGAISLELVSQLCAGER